jgi:hypothetical protein
LPCERGAMLSKISAGQVCGFLYLFILLTSALSKGLAGAPLDPGDASGTLGAVAEGGRRFRSSVALDLVSHAAIFALAGALYLTFSPYNQSLALVAMLWRAAEGTILTLNEVSSAVLLAVAQKFVSATGAEAVSLETLGRALMVADEWGFKTGLAFFALGSLLYGILFLSSGAVPPVLGWWSVAAGLLAVAGTWLALFIPALPVVLKTATFVPIILFELVFGVWLLFRGGQIGALH